MSENVIINLAEQVVITSVINDNTLSDDDSILYFIVEE